MLYIYIYIYMALPQEWRWITGHCIILMLGPGHWFWINRWWPWWPFLGPVDKSEHCWQNPQKLWVYILEGFFRWMFSFRWLNRFRSDTNISHGQFYGWVKKTLDKLCSCWSVFVTQIPHAISKFSPFPSQNGRPPIQNAGWENRTRYNTTQKKFPRFFKGCFGFVWK